MLEAVKFVFDTAGGRPANCTPVMPKTSRMALIQPFGGVWNRSAGLSPSSRSSSRWRDVLDAVFYPNPISFNLSSGYDLIFILTIRIICHRQPTLTNDRDLRINRLRQVLGFA
ncbi:hypothetical protein [Bradyrhizobium icense]